MIEPTFEIVRSFSKTMQERQFEPVNFFCSAKETFSTIPSEKEKKEKSEYLANLVQNEVEKSVKVYFEEKKKNIDETTGMPIIQIEEKPQPQVKKGFGRPFDPTRTWKCGCNPSKGIKCGKHALEHNDATFESQAEGKWFKEEIEQTNIERKEKDAEAVKEYEKNHVYQGA